MFTDQGLIQGRAHETLRARSALDPGIAILADVLVKHATAPPGSSLTAAARDTWHRGLADGLILTGSETGLAVSTRDLQAVRKALPPEARLWVGSGVTPQAPPALLHDADGLIVGSALQKGGVAGGGVEADRVRGLMDTLGR
jgi:predicted TIM-barrel enzyme